jgi:hypothetical protein
MASASNLGNAFVMVWHTGRFAQEFWESSRAGPNSASHAGSCIKSRVRIHGRATRTTNAMGS